MVNWSNLWTTLFQTAIDSIPTCHGISHELEEYTSTTLHSHGKYRNIKARKVTTKQRRLNLILSVRILNLLTFCQERSKHCLSTYAYIVECYGYRFCKHCKLNLQVNRVHYVRVCGFKSFLADKQLQCLLNERKVYCLLRAEGWLERWNEQITPYQHLQITDSNCLTLTDTNVKPCSYVPVTCMHILQDHLSMPGHQQSQVRLCEEASHMWVLQ